MDALRQNELVRLICGEQKMLAADDWRYVQNITRSMAADDGPAGFAKDLPHFSLAGSPLKANTKLRRIHHQDNDCYHVVIRYSIPFISQRRLRQNTKTLYHATSAESARKIAQCGFMLQGSSECMFGSGIYFAQSPEDATHKTCGRGIQPMYRKGDPLVRSKDTSAIITFAG